MRNLSQHVPFHHADQVYAQNFFPGQFRRTCPNAYDRAAAVGHVLPIAIRNTDRLLLPFLA